MESPLKMMKNTFYFVLNALFILKIFKFLSWFFGLCRKNGLIRKKDEFQNSWHHNLVNKQLQDNIS